MTLALVSLHTGLLLVAVFLFCFALFGAIVLWDAHWEKKQQEKREEQRREWRITKSKGWKDS